eukprot:TRINITY_DN944_c0_g1_i1.p1 TRINITY_DN944_c0_g1~~TRINITY_DN944_c0_g1_i1.p1  ORF type:complete len:370 (+),score=57.35 TRINITY_DN944_c0_g1_i1:1139-2248(+)
MLSSNHSTSDAVMSTVKLGPYTLQNRLALAPLTRGRAELPLSVPGKMNALYYAQRAGAGLCITEGTVISPSAGISAGVPGIYLPEQVAGWKIVTDAVHDQGGRIFAQLWHRGRSAGGPDLVSASAVPIRGCSPPRALRTDEIAKVIAEYKFAAEQAKEAGFDGVELHAANGYLVEQFLSEYTNLRTDQYGGSVENRVRFLLNVVDALVEVWSAGKVGVRLSPASTFGDMQFVDRWGTYSHAITELLKRHALGYIHLVEPRIAGADDTDGSQFADTLSSKHFRKLIPSPTLLIAAGAYQLDTATAAIAHGDADMVAFGRLFIANPDLPRRFALRAPLNRYNRATFYTRGPEGYVDYPTLEQLEQRAEIAQ